MRPEEAIALACGALTKGDKGEAGSILSKHYPFVPLSNAGRRYSKMKLAWVFARDGFVDRYSGRRLVFPGTLRLLSKLLPEDIFPFHPRWKTDKCHFAFGTCSRLLTIKCRCRVVGTPMISTIG
jgi:hypothetical protein